MSELRRRLEHDPTLFRELAPLSPAVTKLIGTLTGDDADFYAAESIIRSDPVIAGRFLSAANTAAYIGHMPVTTIRGALFRLGTVESRRLVFMIGLHAAVPGSPVERTAFWKHSLAVAHVAEHIGRLVPTWTGSTNAETAFLSALLHDLGLLILLRHFPRESDKIRDMAEQASRPRWEIERDLLGTDHARLGARLAEHWSFPAVIASVIRGHHDRPDAWDASRELTATVALADALCSENRSTSMGEGTRIDIIEASIVALGLAPDVLGQIVDDAHPHAARDLALLGVAA